MKMAVRTLRRLMDAALAVLVGVVVALVLAAVAGPRLGHQPVVIRGGSMSPAVPLGSLVDVVAVPPEEIAPGDVVMVKAANGVSVTHRVVRVVNEGGKLYFELKGDANSKPDPVLVPAASLTGRVDLVLPVLGYLLFLLTTPSGLASIVGLALTLVLAIWLVEDLERELYRRPLRAAPALVFGRPVGALRLDSQGDPGPVRHDPRDEWIG